MERINAFSTHALEHIPSSELGKYQLDNKLSQANQHAIFSLVTVSNFFSGATAIFFSFSSLRIGKIVVK